MGAPEGQTPMLEPPPQFYQLLGEQAGVWLWSLDGVTRRLDIYSDLTSLFGTHPTDLETLKGLYHPDDLEASLAKLAASLQSGEPGQMECRLLTAAGGWAHFHVSYCAAPNPAGGFILHGVSREITALAAARAAAFETMRQAGLAERLSGIGHWRYDIRGDALTWSEQIYRIHGLKPGAGTRTVSSLVDFVHPDDRERVLELQKLYKGKDSPPI